MTMKFRLCLRAAQDLADDDLASLSDKIEAYRAAGMDDRDSERSAVDDLIAQATSDLGELQTMAREQHGELFTNAPAPAPAKAKESRGPAASRAWVDEGKTPEQLLQDKADRLGVELAGTIREEATAKDFAPSELPQAVATWAADNGVPADMLAKSVVQALPKFDFSEGRLRQIRAALEAAAPAGPTETDAALWKKITAGEATPDDFKAGFEAWVSNKTAILAELSTKTKAELLKMGGAWFADRNKGENKPEVVEALWRQGASAYTLGRSFQYGMGRDSYTNGIRQMVEATDADQLAKYVADLKAEQEEALTRVAKVAEAIKDPKTLSDFNTWMRATMGVGKTFKEARMMLSPEQRAAYDELAADSTRSGRKVKQDAERTTVRVAGQTVDGQIVATKHTKKGTDLFVVRLAERVSREDYDTLNAGAKRIGGHYSSFRGAGAVPGFQFTTREQAQAFVILAGGDNTAAVAAAQERRDAFADDRSQTAAERLTEMAARLEERADESMGRDRKANTERRARFAASAEAAASADKAMAKTMRNIAQAIAGGAAKFLDRVRQKVQVELLQGYVRTAKNDELRAKHQTYDDQERHKGEPPTAETADYAEFPAFTAYRSDLASLGRQLLEVDGTKKLGQQIMKVADDISDAFTAFSKDNFSKVAVFSATGGVVATFGTKDAAEAALSRSGLKGKGIAHQVKRGQYTLVLSPSEAMARGIWKGDGDKRITLTGEFGSELVEKIGRAARRGAKVSVPWQFETAYDRLKQLERMGLETPAEFRAALREFIGLREVPAEPDKVKQLERAMIGRRNDGLDFFPTPDSVADEMVAAANIQPGMRVLEPSAGMGHIAERIREAGTEPEVVEYANDRRELLEAKGFNVIGTDFMHLAKDANGEFDRILMNPPFSEGRDIQHVRHAYSLLKPGGRLVAIMGESAFFGQSKRAAKFRDWLESVGGTDEKLPEGTFNDPSLPVNTGANARMVVVDKAGSEQLAPTDGDTKFSRTSTASGMSVEAVQQVADTVAATWANAPPITVVSDMADSRVPQSVRDEFKRQNDAGATGGAAGFVSGGRVYLVADQLTSPQHAATTLLHEALGHYGLRGVFGSSLDDMLRQFANARRVEVTAKARQYGLNPADPKDRLIAAEEVLSELAQTQPTLGWVQRAVAAVRTWLRTNIPMLSGLRMTDAEVVRDFIVPARGFVERGRAAKADTETAPAFSRTDAIMQVAGKTANALAHYRGMAMQLLGRRQIIDLWAKDIPALTAYGGYVERMDAEKNDTAAEADELANRWGKLPDERQLAELMHDATLARIDADPLVGPVPGEAVDEAKMGELRASFDKLSQAAQQVYRQARDAYTQHHAKVRLAIRERIERAEMSPERRRKLLERMDNKFFKKVQGVYFPLSRFGSYVVVVRNGDGEAVTVSRAETINEAEATRAELLKAFPAAEGYRVGKVIKDREFNAARDGVGRGFMAELFETLEKEGAGEDLADAIGQLYLASLPDLSWAKHGIHRKGTPGFSQDARRAFAQNSFHGDRYLAKLRYADKLQTQLGQMQKEVDGNRDVDGFDSIKAQQVVDEMVKRHESMMSPKSSPISTALTSFGFVFHLGLSPASALVNLLQTALVAYPLMASKWGYARTSTALLKASREAAGARNDMGTMLVGQELEAYQEAVRIGAIDLTQAHDLAGIAQGEDSKVHWKLRPVMNWASFMFHHAERFNRQVTFMAAYRLAREAGAAHSAAFDQAIKATYDGHFDYSAGNRPRLMQGNVAKVVLLFKQFGQNMIYTISRQAYLSMKGQTPEQRKEARKALGGLLTMHAAGAGALGLPLVSTILAAASMLGGSDDEPWDAETALRNMLADTFGAKAADVMAHGLSRLTPWDISGRVGLDRLILPDVQEGLEGARVAESWMTAALGPVAGIGVGVAKGMQAMASGNTLRGMEDMLPSALRGPLRAFRYGTEGAIDKTGIPIKDEVGIAGIAGQALGLSPTEVRLATEGKSAIYQQDHALLQRRQKLVTQYAMAAMAGDQEARDEASAEIVTFNAKNPMRAIRPENLRSSIMARHRRIERSDQGVYLPALRQGAMEAGRFAIEVE